MNLKLSDLTLLLTEDANYLACKQCTEFMTPPGVGFFKLADINCMTNPVFPQSAFRNLKKNIISHIQSRGHVEALASSNIATRSEKSLNAIGMKVAMVAYSTIYNGEPFRIFEKRVCELIAAKTEMGNINHSQQFFRRFMENCYNIVLTDVRSFLSNPLLCTGKRCA